MLNSTTWLTLDNLAFSFQFLLVVAFGFYNARRFGSAVFAWGIVFLQLLFLSPNTRLMFGSVDMEKLWRFFPLDFRPGLLLGLSIYDWILLILMIPSVFTAFQFRRFSSLVVPLVCFSFTFLLGATSIVLRVYEFDINRYLIAFRVAIIVLTFLSLGLLARPTKGYGFEKAFFFQFMVLYCVGCVSMLLLDPASRWNRYGFATFLPSQSFWVASFLAFVVALVYPLNIVWRIGLFIVALFPLWGFSKTAAVLYFLAIILAVVYRTAPSIVNFLGRTRHFVAAAVVLFVASGLISVVLYSMLVDDTGALGTRHYQFLNLYSTLTGDGWARFFVGIGWNQWYRINIDFQEIDYGAWDSAEFANTDFRAALQTPMLPVLRGTGIFGLIAFSIGMVSMAKQAISTYGPRHIRISNLLFLVVAMSAWSAFPEVGFDAAAFSAFIVGYLINTSSLNFGPVLPAVRLQAIMPSARGIVIR